MKLFPQSCPVKTDGPAFLQLEKFFRQDEFLRVAWPTGITEFEELKPDPGRFFLAGHEKSPISDSLRKNPRGALLVSFFFFIFLYFSCFYDLNYCF